MTSPINPNNTFSKEVNALAKASDKKESGSMGEQVSTLAHEKKTVAAQESIAVSQKKQLNAAIIESTLKFSHSESSEGLALMLKTTLQGINDALNASGVETGTESGVEQAYDSGIDFSPEATAERIVAFGTSFLNAYREQNPEMSEEESLTAFVGIISGGIYQGFSEAKEVLGGLKVLEGDVATNIGQTYQLVQEGLKAFEDSLNQQTPEAS